MELTFKFRLKADNICMKVFVRKGNLSRAKVGGLAGEAVGDKLMNVVRELKVLQHRLRC
jgi:hypothetical protein